MSELTERLREEFHDKDIRQVYADEFLNTYIATQIKVLREEAGWTQAQLAEKAGMKQERISVLENVDYSSWTANVLKRIAKALDMRLSIKIESFGTFLDEFETFSRESLERFPFEKDPAFQVASMSTGTAASVLELVKDTAELSSARHTALTKPTTISAQFKLWPLPVSNKNAEETNAALHKAVDTPESLNAKTILLKTA